MLVNNFKNNKGKIHKINVQSTDREIIVMYEGWSISYETKLFLKCIVCTSD